MLGVNKKMSVSKQLKISFFDYIYDDDHMPKTASEYFVKVMKKLGKKPKPAKKEIESESEESESEEEESEEESEEEEEEEESD